VNSKISCPAILAWSFVGLAIVVATIPVIWFLALALVSVVDTPRNVAGLLEGVALAAVNPLAVAYASYEARQQGLSPRSRLLQTSSAMLVVALFQILFAVLTLPAM
jgi:hypothetical protein